MHCTNCGKENEESHEFCMYCGTKLYSPEAGSSEPEAIPEAVKEEPPLPKEKPVSVPQEKKSRRIDRRRVLLIGAGAISTLVIFACIWGAASFWETRIFSPAKQLVYVIQESNQGDATAFMTIRENGKDNKEIYSDNDGFRSTALALDIFPWLRNNTFSPNGNIIAVGDSDGDLLLLDRNSSVPVSVDLQNTGGLAGYGGSQGFSPNGEYFGFTDLDRNTLMFVIVDLEGNEVYSSEDMVFGKFLPDNRRVVVFETDRQNMTGVGILDFLSGDYDYLTGIEEDDTDYTNWLYASYSVVSPDGETVYYVDGKNLMSVPTRGGSPSVVYESDDGIYFSFFSPDERTMAIIDLDGRNLYLYDTRREEKSRITNDVESAVFSSNGDFLAYTTTETNAEKDLYVSRPNGDDKVRIVRDASWLKYAFSPNNRYLAYIDGSSDNNGGSLYIVRRDGSDPTRLDTGVWSFRFTEDGNSIIYVKVSDLDQDDPESEIYRIRTNGRNREIILQADDGLYTFLWPVP